MKVKLACCAALLLGLMVTPAMATIIASVQPALTTVPFPNAPVTVNIVADIPEADAIVGWGLDMDLVGTSVSVLGIPVIGGQFESVFTPDGDGLAGVLPFSNLDPVWGNGVLLATVTLSVDAPGWTFLNLGANEPLIEGFALAEPVGQFAAVTWVNGAVEVLPEPASFLLLALGALLRRR